MLFHISNTLQRILLPSRLRPGPRNISVRPIQNLHIYLHKPQIVSKQPLYNHQHKALFAHTWAKMSLPAQSIITKVLQNKIKFIRSKRLKLSPPETLPNVKYSSSHRTSSTVPGWLSRHPIFITHSAHCTNGRSNHSIHQEGQMCNWPRSSTAIFFFLIKKILNLI